MKKIIVKILMLLCMTAPSFAQAIDYQLLPELMQSQPEKFQFILDNANRLRVQILYTQINRDARNHPSFTSYGFRLNAQEYFYPASTVKFPACILALEKLNKLNIKGLDKDTPMFTGVSYDKQTSVSSDFTAPNGLPSIAHYIKKILMVSDNDAFNRLYEWLGQDGFNDGLRAKGYDQTRMVHRLQISMNAEQNKRTNPITFKNGDQVIYEQPLATATKNYFPLTPIKLGKGYYKGDSLVKEPMDFTTKNFFPLLEQQAILKAILFPQAVEPAQRFDLKAQDYAFLYKYMSQMPTESVSPVYDATAFYPAYCKFLLYGGDKNAALNPNLRIFNKVGDAYGFLLDNAYIVDFSRGVEFMLSAVILCNEDQIFNDNQYDYETIGFPFMKHLGELIYEYEAKRPKKHSPNLAKFKLDYDK